MPTRPELPDVLLPQNYQPPEDLAPPPGTVLGPNGNLVAVGPPLINPNPNLADPNPPLPRGMSPSPPVPGTANPALIPVPPPPVPLSPGPRRSAPKPGRTAGPPSLPAEAAPASFGGNVGPVGSEQERDSSASSPGNRRRRPPSCCSVRSHAGTTVSVADPTSAGSPDEDTAAPMIGLSLFMVVAVTLTWLVYVTLRRDVAGQTVPYAAMFSDVFGLREGDDVRMAGVRVGRVEKIELQGDLAKVSFVVQNDQQLLGTTVASVTYQNIVGQRYLGTVAGQASASPGR